MTDHNEDDNNSNIRRKDVRFACGMISIYAICCVIFISGTFIWVREDRNVANANSTATIIADLTQRANVTATVIARSTEQSQFGQIDPFNDNSKYWLTESVNGEFFTGTIDIAGGVYVWNINEVKKPFVYWAKYFIGGGIRDFDVYVDTKIAKGAPGTACSGYVFRMASVNWEEGAYIFSVCNNSYFYVDYYENGEWEDISDWMYSNAIQNYDWNRLEIVARGNQFAFIINHETVFEMTDDRQPRGGLALFVEVRETSPSSIWFDNFGFQTR